MKYILSSLLVLCFFLNASAENKKKPIAKNKVNAEKKAPAETTKGVKKPKNDLTRAKLKGNIKSVTEMKYKVSGTDSAYKYNIVSKNVHNYNENGNETEIMNYDENNKLRGKATLKYNKAGKLAEHYTTSDEGTIYKNETYAYDSKGNKSELDYYNTAGASAGKALFKYDDNGNMIEVTEYEIDSTIKLKHTNKYDKKGNKIEEKFFKPNAKAKKGNTVLFQRVTYKYDNAGNRVEENVYSGNNILESKVTSQYNENNEKTSEKEDIKAQKLQVNYSWKYEQKDENGNWLQKTLFENNKPTEMVQRKIKYAKDAVE